MRLALVPESLIEWIALKLGFVPLAVAESQVGFNIAQAIIVGVKTGVFEALAAGADSAQAVAERCGTNPGATHKLMNLLAAAGYLRERGGQFTLTTNARRWLLRDAPMSMYEKIHFEGIEYGYAGRYENFVRHGETIRLHETLDDEGWTRYIGAMRDLARVSAPEVAWRTPIPRGARDLLDLGGSHGQYAAALCRRHPKLRGVVLDLPPAVRVAAPMLAACGMGDRVVHREGDALTSDLGTGAWDAVLVSQMLHHYNAETNRALIARIAASLRPGGVLIVQEFLRPKSVRGAGQIGTMLDLYFAATSDAGTWSHDEIVAWQRGAGLRALRARRLRTMPGVAQLVAKK